MAKILLCLTLMILIGCGKSKSPEIDLSSNTQKIVSPDLVAQVAAETDKTRHDILLINSSLSIIPQSMARNIIEYHTEKKINNIDFRALFWNAQISKELLLTLNGPIKNDKTLSKLDSNLINLVLDKEITVSEVLTNIEDDEIGIFPTPMRTVIIDNLSRKYLTSSDKEIIKIYGIVNEIKSNQVEDEKKLFLKQIISILELNYYKHLLSTKRLVARPVSKIDQKREIMSSFFLDYNFSIGRCGIYKGKVQFDNLENSFGMNCNTETPSTVDLDIFNKIEENDNGLTLDLLVRNFVRGGYDRNHKEDATSGLNYRVTGKIVIPKCETPSTCSQIITISAVELGREFTGARLNNSEIMIKINGEYFENKFLSSRLIDISKSDAEIDVILTKNKSHIGACCTQQAEYQKINIAIGTKAPEIPMRIKSEDEAVLLSPFKSFMKLPLFGYSFESIDDYPSRNLFLLDRVINRALVDKKSNDDYRFYFYTSLNMLNMSIEDAVNNSLSPIEIAGLQQLKSSISDRVGRKTIYPIIISKQLALAQTSNKLQNKLNNILIMLLDNNINLEILSEKVFSVVNNNGHQINSEIKDELNDFLKIVNQNQSSSVEILDHIKELQSEFSFINKKMNLEIELLNLERAQFEEY